MTILTGTAYWTHIVMPNNKEPYPSGKYEIVLGNLDADNIIKIKSLGQGGRLKNKGDELGTFIKIKSKFQPSVIDKNKNEVNPIPLIGNGSKVALQINEYSSGKFGMQLGVQTIMLLDLVAYTPGETKFKEFDDELPQHMQG